MPVSTRRPGFAGLGHKLLEPLGLIVEIVQKKIGAFLGVAEGDGRAENVTRPGDHRDLVF